MWAACWSRGDSSGHLGRGPLGLQGWEAERGQRCGGRGARNHFAWDSGTAAAPAPGGSLSSVNHVLQQALFSPLQAGVVGFGVLLSISQGTISALRLGPGDLLRVPEMGTWVAAVRKGRAVSPSP